MESGAPTHLEQEQITPGATPLIQFGDCQSFAPQCAESASSQSSDDTFQSAQQDLLSCSDPVSPHSEFSENPDSPSQPEHSSTVRSYLHQISYAPDDDPFSEIRRPVRTTSLSDARQQLVEACVDYVFNSLPTHLLRIADLAIVTRNEIWDAERPRIEDIEDDKLRELRYEYSKTLGWHFTGFLERSWCEEYAKDVFKFAIFSHRWGDREPLFHEMAAQTRTIPVPNSPGYDKLLHLCEKARTDFGCRYVWSDTCCINKESSSELEEAIRSMYRWYSLANVCIVHLGRSSSVDDFENEPWFTRGWTLQELLAPNHIRFYGRDWDPICPQRHAHGDKANETITHAITRVTDIPEGYLQRFRPSCALVAQIMTWSAKRRTTRIEDRAYALLGLFDVSIPIAYGEGPRAFYRLMVALANECLTPAFFTWAGRPSDFSNALPASPECYARISPGKRGGNDDDDDDANDNVARNAVGAWADAGHPSYQVTKLGVVAHLVMCCVRRKFALRGGFHVGTTWHFDEHVPLEPFAVRAGTGAALPPHMVTLAEDDEREYALGVVDFACPEPNGHHGELVRGKRYVGLLMMREKWGWEKLSTDLVISVNCTRDMRAPVESVLLLHAVVDSLYQF